MKTIRFQLLAVGSLCWLVVAATNETYSVNAGGVWSHTNCIAIKRCSEFCIGLTYVEDGVTNVFHAAFVMVTVKTNKVPKPNGGHP